MKYILFRNTFYSSNLQALLFQTNPNSEEYSFIPVHHLGITARQVG